MKTLFCIMVIIFTAMLFVTCTDISKVSQDQLIHVDSTMPLDSLNFVYFIGNDLNMNKLTDVLDLGIAYQSGSPENPGKVIRLLNTNSNSLDSIYSFGFKPGSKFVSRPLYPLPFIMYPDETSKLNQIEISFDSNGRLPGIYMDTLNIQSKYSVSIVVKVTVE